MSLAPLKLYRDSLKSIAVESTFNWYWLVDGLIEQGYDVQLVNTAAIKQYDGLKYSGDQQDGFHLASLDATGYSTDWLYLSQGTTPAIGVTDIAQQFQELLSIIIIFINIIS
jgi:hypothetical protein